MDSISTVLSALLFATHSCVPSVGTVKIPDDGGIKPSPGIVADGIIDSTPAEHLFSGIVAADGDVSMTNSLVRRQKLSSTLELTATASSAARPIRTGTDSGCNQFQNFTDPRENYITKTKEWRSTTYKMVQIGTQTWMAENLAYDDTTKRSPKRVSRCMFDEMEMCQAFGRLYSWDAATSICPIGWHLPSDVEWQILEREIGMTKEESEKEGWRGTVANELKSQVLWEYKGVRGNGNDKYGFTLLPAGRYIAGEKGGYRHFSEHADFWTSTKYNNEKAWSRWFTSGDHITAPENGDFTYAIRRMHWSKDDGRSVRCVKDQDCGNGCSRRRRGGRCASRRRSNGDQCLQACATTSDCPSGYACVGKLCEVTRT